MLSKALGDFIAGSSFGETGKGRIPPADGFSTFDSIDDIDEALTFFDGLTIELQKQNWGELSPEIGCPILKLWRSNTSDQFSKDEFLEPFVWSENTQDIPWSSLWNSYPAASYIYHVSCNSSETGQSPLHALKSEHIEDVSTRLLAFEAVMYNPTWERYTFLQLKVEFRPGAGVVTHKYIQTFKIGYVAPAVETSNIMKLWGFLQKVIFLAS